MRWETGLPTYFKGILLERAKCIEDELHVTLSQRRGRFCSSRAFSLVCHDIEW